MFADWPQAANHALGGGHVTAKQESMHCEAPGVCTATNLGRLSQRGLPHRRATDISASWGTNRKMPQYEFSSRRRLDRPP